MKKLFFIFVFFLFLASLQAQENLFDFRLSTAGASPKYTYIYRGRGWQGFVQVGTSYMLWEAGPRLSREKFSVTARLGCLFEPRTDELLIEPQGALVIFLSWKGIDFLSINEISPVKGAEYYYEQGISYKFYNLHFEAVYQGGGYEPFLGPGVSFPLSKGKIFFWLAQRYSTSQKFARVGYSIAF